MIMIMMMMMMMMMMMIMMDDEQDNDDYWGRRGLWADCCTDKMACFRVTFIYLSTVRILCIGRNVLYPSFYFRGYLGEHRLVVSSCKSSTEDCNNCHSERSKLQTAIKTKATFDTFRVLQS